MSENPLQLQSFNKISDLGEVAWDRVAGISTYQANNFGNPFVSYRFLKALEDSQSVGGNSGWYPQYLAVIDRSLAPESRILAAAPVYIKMHSQGEYVFDHSWSEASNQLGIDYYPKLQLSVPFSPVPGPRLLVAPEIYQQDSGTKSESRVDSGAGWDSGASTESNPHPYRTILAKALITLCQEQKMSGIHATFCNAADAAAFKSAGYMERHSYQFHWHNQNYGDFDGFLATLASRKRKAIRKERAEAAASGIVIETLSGAEIKPHHLEAYDQCYRAISARKWGRPYLTRQFFEAIHATMSEQMVLILARDGDRYIGGALNFRNSHTLFGRSWGSVSEQKFLHFEACYYRAIDYAIAHGLQRVEAGVQGEHKLQRGYLPIVCRSFHWLADERLGNAVNHFLKRERDYIAAEIAELTLHSPYRQE